MRNFSFIKILILATALAAIFGCSNEISKDAEKEYIALTSSIAKKIDNEFAHFSDDATALAQKITHVYMNKGKYLPTVDKSKYKLHSSGVFYKFVNDGEPALWISGFVKVDEKIQEIAYFTEGFNEDLKMYVTKHPEVVQSYYNDKHSLNRIYPPFDTFAQYEPKMNIPEFNFYYLADAKHNPQKRTVWVPETYVDPAGRGWMVSVISPVYVNDKLEGVCGLDVTVNKISDIYLKGHSEVMITDNTGTVVASSEYALRTLGMPGLGSHKYMETVKQDSFRKADYNILKSKIKEVREASKSIYDRTTAKTVLILDNKEYIIFSDTVNELGWKVIAITERYIN